MSKSSLIKQSINNKIQIINKDNNEMINLFNEDLSFEKNFINSNLSFDNYFNQKNKILNKNIDLKNIDFIKDINDEMTEIKSILSELNKNIEITIKDKNNNKECQEILNILKKPLSDRNIRYFSSPFRPLEKPKKISMIGKIIFDSTKDEEDYKNEITQNSSNINDINYIMVNDNNL